MGVGGRVWGCQGGWERRIEAFVKIQKKNNFFFVGGGSGRGGGGGRRGVWLGVSVDVNREVKFFKKKNDGGGVGVGWGSGGAIRGWGDGGSKVWGSRGMGDVNQE